MNDATAETTPPTPEPLQDEQGGVAGGHPRPMIPDRLGLRYSAAVVSGALVAVASPPIGQAWTQWFTLAPLLFVFTGHRKTDARLGYVGGVALIAANFAWLAKTITLFSDLGWVLASLVVLLFASVFALPYALLGAMARPLRERFGALWVPLYAAAWTGVEWLTPQVFPFAIGAPQYRTLWVWQLVSVFGLPSMTFLMLLTNGTLAELFLARRERKDAPWALAGAVVGIFLANLAFGAWRVRAVAEELASARVIRASLLQQGVTMVQRITERGDTVLKSWLELTAKVQDQRPDLVVWPEGSVYLNPNAPNASKRFGGMAKAGGYGFLLGGGTRERDPLDVTRGVSFNSAWYFNPDGSIGGRYDKMVPLPFGEYLPWPFTFLRGHIEGIGNFRAGTSATVFQGKGFTFTTPICYEAILERQMRKLNDADLFVNITNDGWFGDTFAPHQHAMLAVTNATQFGRPMLRIAYTGVSMVVEPDGRIVEETLPYTEVARVVPIRMATLDTPYRTWGGAFPWLCAAVAAWLSWGLRARGPATRSSDGGDA